MAGRRAVWVLGAIGGVTTAGLLAASCSGTNDAGLGPADAGDAGAAEDRVAAADARDAPFVEPDAAPRYDACAPWATGSGPPELVDCAEGSPWTFESVRPIASTVNASFAAPDGTAWLVGACGRVLSVHGDRVSLACDEGHTSLHGVWAASANDAWAVGDGGGVLHWDGAEWRRVQLGGQPNLTSVWGSGPHDVWIGGECTLARGDAAGFARWPLEANITQLWGFASDDVWAGEGLLMRRFDGHAWKTTPFTDAGVPWQYCEGYGCFGSPLPNRLWGAAPDDLWTSIAWRSGSGSAYLGHWDGHEWSISGFDLLVAALTGTARDDVYAIGDVLSEPKSSALRWDGHAWSAVPALDREYGGHYASAVATPQGLVVAGSNGIERLAAGGITRLDPPVPDDMYAVWQATPDEVWAGGEGLLRRDATGWHLVIPKVWVSSIGGTARDDVWFGGGEGIWHWDGQAWTQSWNGREAIWSLWADARDDVWAVEWSRVLHWDGRAWSISFQDDAGAVYAFRDVWASGPRDAWAIANTGDYTQARFHWDGARWSRRTSDVDDHWERVVGFGKDDVVFVGMHGNEHHGTFISERWDGVRFRRWTGDRMLDDVGDLSAAGNELYAFTGDGTLLRSTRTSDAWTETPLPGCLGYVGGGLFADDDGAWLVGSRGTILRYSPARIRPSR